MEHFWGASILKCSVHISCFSVSHPYFRVPIHFHKNKIFVLQEFILLSPLFPIMATNLYLGCRATLGPADCGQMNRESLGNKQQPQMIRGAASLVFSLLIPADPVQTIINLTSVLNCFKLNLLFTEIIPETLKEVLKEDIIWLPEN